MSTVGPSLERTAVDGVPVLWANGPEPYVGALVFRAGQADETFATAGLSHLVEHLALFTAGRRQFEVNGFVADTRTAFVAVGTREEVCGFLSDIARALGSLPLERLESERRVLLTEAQARAPHPLGILLACRFGHSGFGLVDNFEFALHRCDAEEVASWARERFTSGNAAAWLTGPPADGLSLPLSDGVRFAPPGTAAIPGLKLPAHVETGSGAVLLSFLAPRSVAAAAAARVAGDRVEGDLRTGAGLSYAAGGIYWPLTADTAQISLRADCLDEHATEVRDRMLSALSSVAEAGPTGEELTDYVDSIRRTFADPRSVTNFLDSETQDLLMDADKDSPQVILEKVESLTADEIAVVVRDGLPTTLLAAPERTPPPSDGFVPYLEESEHATAVEGVAYKIGGWRRKNRILAGDAGISYVDDENGKVVTILRDDVVGLISYGTGRLTVVGARGAEINVDAANLKNGDALDESLRRRFAAVLVPLEDLDGRETVERLASEKLKRRWPVTDEIEVLPSVLAPGEDIVTLAEASRGMKTGLLVVTDRRIFFVHEGLRKKASELLEVGYEEIESVRATEGITAVRAATIRIRRADGELKFSDVTPRERAPELAAEIRARAGLPGDQ